MPAAVHALCRRLSDAGVGAWLCGGTVRDLVLGRDPADWDLATDALPATLRGMLPADWFEADQPGEAHGSLALRIDDLGLELTTLRVEGEYRDGRRPESVTFVTDLEADHRRRDFTVNALYADFGDGKLHDFCGGLTDAAQLRLHAVGEPAVRFGEDALRSLRAVRFCAELGLVADADTWQGLTATAAGAARLSATRAFAELDRILRAPGRARGLVLLVRSGLAPHVLPGLAEMQGVPQPEQFHPEGDVLRHTALVLANLRPPVDPILAWAALFHDIAKKDCLVRAADRIRFDGHDVLGAERAETWLAAAGAPRALIDAVREIVAEHIHIASVPRFRPARRNRFLTSPRFAAHLEFHRADCLACHGWLDVHDELARLQAALPPDLPEPLLRGRDLVALGIPPGPGIGRLLAAIAEARFAGEITDTESARALALRLWREGSG
jgi:poly(A) polymerase